MEEYISKTEVLKVLRERQAYGMRDVYNRDVYNSVNLIPSKKKSEICVKEGKWISLEPVIGLYSCSLCEWNIVKGPTNYCPNCGAKMSV